MSGNSVRDHLTKILICVGIALTSLSGAARAEVDEKYLEALEYRLVGPFRGAGQPRLRGMRITP